VRSPSALALKFWPQLVFEKHSRSLRSTTSIRAPEDLDFPPI